METQVHVHNQAKQTETSEFGTEKGLLQGQQVDGMSYALKTSGSQKGFGKAFLKARCEFRCVCVWEGCRVCDQLVYSSDSLMVRQPVGVTGVNIVSS